MNAETEEITLVFHIRAIDYDTHSKIQEEYIKFLEAKTAALLPLPRPQPLAAAAATVEELMTTSVELLHVLALSDEQHNSGSSMVGDSAVDTGHIDGQLGALVTTSFSEKPDEPFSDARELQQGVTVKQKLA